MTAPNRAVVALLTVGAIAIGFAAADTYVVVLALPEMMTATGLKIDDLQRAAPIVSGFLLGYVAVLPLIGKIADIRGRVPVLLACLVIFSFGSLITAAGHDLNTLVAGRFIQGVGGGGLIPPILALIGDTWPPRSVGSLLVSWEQYKSWAQYLDLYMVQRYSLSVTGEIFFGSTSSLD